MWLDSVQKDTVLHQQVLMIITACLLLGVEKLKSIWGQVYI